MSKHFWMVIERGSYLATLFISLVEILRVISSCLY
jgi:hypothetical protein